MITEAWEQSQQNRITFVLVDSNNVEVPGLGTTFTLELAKNGGAFAGSAGTKAEISDGWYTYLSTAAEADTPGPVSIKITGGAIVQQNLEYVVRQRNSLASLRTYTVVSSASGNPPIEGVSIQITTDLAGANVIWTGETNSSGVAVDDNGNKPFLEAGTYYFWRQLSGYTFSNPDTEVFA